MASPGLAAVQIGREIGATAREVNRLLWDQGFLEKVHGCWALTDKGVEHGVQFVQTSSNLPQAKSWDVTRWHEGILDVLDTSAAALAKAREGLRVDRMAQSAQLRLDREQADAVFLAAQAATHQLQDAAPALIRSKAAGVIGISLAGVAVATVAGFAAKRIWRARRQSQQPTPAKEQLPQGGADNADEA